jgi:hypothetical protein
MTHRWRLEAFTIVGLTVVCLALGSYIVMSGPRPGDAGDLRHFEISSIDLTTGARDASFSAIDMVPGDAVMAAITVANPGRRPMTYRLSRSLVSASEGVLSALILTIRTIGSSCADFDGTVLYEGRLDEAAFGSERYGRPLPGATAEILCFRTVLPRAVDNRLQGAAATISLTFTASWQAAVR